MIESRWFTVQWWKPKGMGEHKVQTWAMLLQTLTDDFKQRLPNSFICELQSGKPLVCVCVTEKENTQRFMKSHCINNGCVSVSERVRGTEWTIF